MPTLGGDDAPPPPPPPDVDAEPTSSGANQADEDAVEGAKSCVGSHSTHTAATSRTSAAARSYAERRVAQPPGVAVKLRATDVTEQAMSAAAEDSCAPQSPLSHMGRELNAYSEIVLVQMALKTRSAPSHALSIAQRLTEMYPRDVQVSRCRMDQVLTARPTVTYFSHNGVPVPKLQVRVIDVHPTTPHVSQIITSYLLNQTACLRLFVLLPDPTSSSADDADRSESCGPWEEAGEDGRARASSSGHRAEAAAAAAGAAAGVAAPSAAAEAASGRRTSPRQAKPRVKGVGREKLRLLRQQLEEAAGQGCALRVPADAGVFPFEASAEVEAVAESAVDTFKALFLSSERMRAASSLSQLAQHPAQSTLALCAHQELRKRCATYQGYQRGRCFHAPRPPEQPQQSVQQFAYKDLTPPLPARHNGRYLEPQFKFDQSRRTVGFVEAQKKKGAVDAARNRVQWTEVLTLDTDRNREVAEALTQAQVVGRREEVDLLMPRLKRPTPHPSGYAFEQAGLLCRLCEGGRSGDKDAETAGVSGGGVGGGGGGGRLAYYEHYDIPYAVRNTALCVTAPPSAFVPHDRAADAAAAGAGVLSTLNLDASRCKDPPANTNAFPIPPQAVGGGGGSSGSGGGGGTKPPVFGERAPRTALPERRRPFASFGRLEKAVLEQGSSTMVTDHKEPAALSSLVKYAYEGRINHCHHTPPQRNRPSNRKQDDLHEWDGLAGLAPKDPSTLRPRDAPSDAVVAVVGDDGHAVATTAPQVPAAPDAAEGDASAPPPPLASSHKELLVEAMVRYHMRLQETERARLTAPLRASQHVPVAEPLTAGLSPSRAAAKTPSEVAREPARPEALISVAWLPDGCPTEAAPPPSPPPRPPPYAAPSPSHNVLHTRVHPAYKLVPQVPLEDVYSRASGRGEPPPKPNLATRGLQPRRLKFPLSRNPPAHAVDAPSG